ncbi:hypothetical protein H8B02_18080 [Bradyrhizobium sp. Pear77]|nr:hypothetical protein [Bradyrhizobium altum]MCC8955276.1 hypothetical protein [Bradyrhizobium altum]
MARYFALLFALLISCCEASADDAFGHIVTPTRILPAVCNVKYSGADRTGLYNLGFTDR